MQRRSSRTHEYQEVPFIRLDCRQLHWFDAGLLPVRRSLGGSDHTGCNCQKIRLVYQLKSFSFFDLMSCYIMAVQVFTDYKFLISICPSDNLYQPLIVVSPA